MPIDRPSAPSSPEPAADDAGISDVERRLGSRIAALRADRGWTQDQLAAAIGATKSYISKIENGRLVPPVGTLLKIAGALKHDVAELLKEAPEARDDAVCIVRAAEHPPAMRGASAFGYDYVALTRRGDERRLQPFLFTFPPRSERAVRFDHEGEEFIHVLSGRVEFEFVVGGEARGHVLEAGDSVHFRSSIPHRGYSLGETAARALVVILSAAQDD
jgi:transcriptional regulator with XRE-family HTH domain